jgi:hypothetical protein
MRLMLAAALLACGAVHAQDCPIKQGDPIDAVKRHFSINVEPAKQPRVTPGGTAYQYQLSGLGIWIFFDANQRVTTMRFEPPFFGSIGGVRVGDTKEAVRRARGEPQRIMDQGMPDMADLAARRQRKQELIDRLPDPAPRREVQQAFQEISRIDAQPPKWLTAWVYSPGTPNFVRYDFGGPDDTVQIIFSARCS